MSDVMNRLNQVFRDVFDDDSLEVGAATTAKDVDGWDSLMHVNLVVAIETAFKVKFTTREVTNLANVGELAQLLEAKLAR